MLIISIIDFVLLFNIFVFQEMNLYKPSRLVFKSYVYIIVILNICIGKYEIIIV